MIFLFFLFYFITCEQFPIIYKNLNESMCLLSELDDLLECSDCFPIPVLPDELTFSDHYEYLQFFQPQKVKLLLPREVLEGLSHELVEQLYKVVRIIDSPHDLKKN